MDFAQLAARAAARREFEQAAGAATFRLRLPTAFEQRQLAASLMRPDGSIDVQAFTRELVLKALIGWSGVTERDFVDEAETDEAVEYSREAAGAYLDERLPVMDELARAVNARIEARAKGLEQEKKPLPPTSAAS